MDKKASAMLDLVRSCGLVFTATTSRMLSAMMRGQVRAFTTIIEYSVKIKRSVEKIFKAKAGTREFGDKRSVIHLCSILTHHFFTSCR